jgi:hypothetical protein
MAFKAKLDMLTAGNKEYKLNPSIQTVHIHKLGHCKVCSSSVFHILPPASSHMHEHCTPTVNSQSICVLFADDTSITTYHTERDHFQNSINEIYLCHIELTAISKVTLHFDINFTKLASTNRTCINLNRGQGNKMFKETVTSKLNAH